MGILEIAGIVLAVLAGTVALYLAIVVFAPFFREPVAETWFAPDPRREVKPNWHSQDVTFHVDGVPISAWLYLPLYAAEPVPCVVMSNGFAGTKDCLSDRYAERFIGAGIAVLSYDYRHFGRSGGRPRQLFSVAEQLTDLEHAVAYARSRMEIDPGRIALWGCSASGGYGLIVAARDHRIACVVAQCAALDPGHDGWRAMTRDGLRGSLRRFVHAQRDKARARFGLSPHRIPAVGRPGTSAALTAPGAYEGYAQLMRTSRSFRNTVCARMFLERSEEDLAAAAAQVSCPVLIIRGEKDELVTTDSQRRIEQALGEKLTVTTYPAGHFELYGEPHFEAAVSDTIAFLQATFLAGVQTPEYAPTEPETPHIAPPEHTAI